MKKWRTLIIPLLVALSLLVPGAIALAQESSELSLTKTADVSAASLNETITYSYEITNTSEVTISELTLTDDKLGDITLSVTSLAPGETTTATASYVVVSSDFPGPIENTATVSGTDPDGAVVTAEAEAAVTLEADMAALEITKTADKTSATPYETVTYTYTIKNTGEVTVDNITLSDSKLGAITLETSALEPGQSLSATKTYEVTVADLPGPVVNTATVQGTDPSGTVVVASSSEVSVSLYVNKSILSKAEILKLSGVPGKGIEKAPGLQKPFNPKSKAAQKAGKKK